MVTTSTINQLLHEDNAKDIFTTVLMDLDIESYMEIWNELNIINLEQMNNFINRPSTMYNIVINALSKVRPYFPEVPYFLLQFEEDVEKVVTDLKYFKEFVQMKCQCSLVELVCWETEITIYCNYKELTPGKQQLWLEELSKNADSYKEMSRYSSVQNILNKQDEMVTLVRDKQPGVQVANLPSGIVRNRGMQANQVCPGRGFGLGGGSSDGRALRVPACTCTELDLGWYNGNIVQRPLQNGEAASIPENISIGPPGVVIFTDVLDDKAPTGITMDLVDMEAIRVLTESEQNIIYDNVQHIYMSKESCTLNMNNLPVKEADAVYALIGGYGSNYFNCYGRQNDPH
jgi:hypothetical protein